MALNWADKGKCNQPGVLLLRARQAIVLLFVGFAVPAAAQESTSFSTSVSVPGLVAEAEVTVAGPELGSLEVIREMVETANRELSLQLRDDVRFSREALQPLAAYIDLLFTELDAGAPDSLATVSLEDAQRDFLFNLYLELNESQLPLEGPRAEYLESVGFDYAEYLARRISEQARQLGECLGAEGSAAGELTISEDLAACADGPPGTTLWVNRIGIANPESFSTADVDLESAQAVLETQRKLYMGDPDKGVVGFPVEGVLGLVLEIRDWYAASLGGMVQSRQVEASTMEQLEHLRRGRGISFDQLKAIALELQNSLRRQEYFLARVYIPQQDFRAAAGDIELAVSFGTLGDVTLRNAEDLHYSDNVLLDPFRDYIGERVSRDIYQAYFSVNALPGVRIRSGLFEPGDEPGETRLVLDVEEDRFRVTLAADNYGSEFTGEERGILAVDWFSPLGRGDYMNLGVLQSIDPSDSTYGYFNYTLPVIGINHELALSWDSHEYDSIDTRTGEEILLQGEVDSYYAGYNYKWIRSKSFNAEFGLRWFQRQSDTEVSLANDRDVTLSEVNTDVTGGLISSSGDMLVSPLRMILGWYASVLYAEQDDAANRQIDEEYWRFALDTQGRVLLPWGPGADGSQLSLHFIGAYTSDVLPSFEQTPLGGPFGVRAYRSFDFNADSLAFLSMEWRFDVGQHLLGNLADQNSLRLGLFVEGGYGEANAIGIADDSWAVMSAYGLLLDYDWRDSVSLKVSLSLPAHDDTSDDFTGQFSDDDYTVLFDLRYQFD